MPKVQVFLKVWINSWVIAFTLPTCSMPGWRGAHWQDESIWLCGHPTVLAWGVGVAGDGGEAMLGGLGPGGPPTNPDEPG